MFVLPAELLISFFLSLPFAVKDFRTRKIERRLFLLPAAVSAVCIPVFQRTFSAVLLSLLPGAVLYLLSVVTGEQIGKGDALYFLCSAGLLSAGKILRLLALCSFFAAAVALFRICAHKRTPLPFLAFLPPALFLMILSEVIR